MKSVDSNEESWAEKSLEDKNKELLKRIEESELQLQARIREVALLKEETNNLKQLVPSILKCLSFKDEYTAGHSKRVSLYASLLAEEVGIPVGLEVLHDAALYHDIGKIAVLDYLLKRRGPLSKSEFEHVALHSEYGFSLFSEYDRWNFVAFVILFHHYNYDDLEKNLSSHWERYFNKKISTTVANDLILYTSIISIVDSFDAITSDRPYSPKTGIQEGKDRLQNSPDNKYNNALLSIFLNIPNDKLVEIYNQKQELDPEYNFNSYDGTQVKQQLICPDFTPTYSLNNIRESFIISVFSQKNFSSGDNRKYISIEPRYNGKADPSRSPFIIPFDDFFHLEVLIDYIKLGKNEFLDQHPDFKCCIQNCSK